MCIKTHLSGQNMSLILILIQVMSHFQSMRAACDHFLHLMFCLFPDLWWMTAEQAQRGKLPSLMSSTGTETDNTQRASVRLKPNHCLKVFGHWETFDVSRLEFHVIPHRSVTESSPEWKTLIPTSVCRSKPLWSRTFLFSILWLVH